MINQKKKNSDIKQVFRQVRKQDDT